MSTFLELCNRLHLETGEGGTDLTTTLSQTGYKRRVVNHIKNSWLEIQAMRTSWRFMRMPALPTVTSGNNTIDADAWVLANLSTNIDFIHKETFSIYLTADGISDESRLQYIKWENWKDYFGITYNDGVTDRPTHVTIDPDTNNIVIGPAANDSYTLHFEFKKTAQEFSADADEPNIAEEIQPIIVWKALEDYGWSEESQAAISKGSMKYKYFKAMLERRELSEISICGTLA